MIDYFFLIFCLLSIINIKIKGIDDFFYDYMDLKNTSSIKGIFVWLIIFHHKKEYGMKKNYIFDKITAYFGQKLVSMFLFYSGFGIYFSVKKKGINYVKTLPQKAIIIFIKSQIIILMFLITNIFLLKHKISFKLYLFAIIFKSSLGNSFWFAFTIIILYFYAYLSFRFVGTKIFIGIFIINSICILHIILVYNFYYPKMIIAVDTVLCFVFGFYYSLLKPFLDKILMKNDIIYFFIISFFIFAYYKFFIRENVISFSISNTLFSFIVTFITMKVQFNNEILKFLNSHSYSIYLLQRLIFMTVFEKKIFKDNEFIQLSFEFTSIFFLSSAFDKYSIIIDKFFKSNIHNIKIKYSNDIEHKILINV